jgi:hypothetical protein
MRSFTFIFSFVILFFSTSFKPNQSRSSQNFQNQPRKIVLYIFGDTNDATIRQGVNKNITNITSFFENVAQTMGSTLETKKFLGSLFSSHYITNNVKFQLTTRNFGENPIIIFYYVGHGISSPNSESPSLTFSNNENYPLKNIEKLIENQLPNSSHWIIAETCNTNSFQVTENGKTDYTLPRDYLEKSQTSLLKDKLNQLFSRNLFLYSAKKGKPAYINNNGGIFLNHFLATGKELLEMPPLLDLDKFVEHTETKMATTKIKLSDNREVIQTMGYEK